MKKALLITLEYPPQIGGVANYYANLVAQLPEEKIEVMTNAEHQLLFNFPIWPRWLRALVTVRKKILQENFKTLIVGQVLPLGTVALVLKKMMEIDYIVMTHAMDITVPQKYPRKKWLMKQILNNAKQVVTVSQYTRTEIQKMMEGKKQHRITIIPPGPNITAEKYPDARAKIDKETLENKKIILSVGRLVKRKGHDMVIKAMPLVLKKFPDAKYLIVGEGEYRAELEQLVKKLKLENSVNFLGALKDDQQVAALYHDCNLFIMPSRQLENNDVEGFGLVFLEANSFGKPVIAGNSGGVTDAVVDGQTGFLVEPEDKQMISKAIIQLLYNPELAQKLGKQGAERVKEKFSWSLQAQRLMHLLK